MPNERLRTQISSKYSPDNPGLFHFKDKLKKSNVEVAYPIGDEIIGYDEGFAITVPHEAYLPFYSSEIRFLKEVKNNPIHIVYNIYGNEEGYVGESTSIETAYAMMLGKPIVFLREPIFAQTVSPVVRKIMEDKFENIVIFPLDVYAPEQVVEILSRLSTLQYNYEFSSEQQDLLVSEIVVLCRKYLASWKSYKDKI